MAEKASCIASRPSRWTVRSRVEPGWLIWVRRAGGLSPATERQCRCGPERRGAGPAMIPTGIEVVGRPFEAARNWTQSRGPGLGGSHPDGLKTGMEERRLGPTKS